MSESQNLSQSDSRLDVHDLMVAVKVAKVKQCEYDVAQAALADAREAITDMIGGDQLSAVANAERLIGRFLTEPDAALLEQPGAGE